jgi:hypothetical protein
MFRYSLVRLLVILHVSLVLVVSKACKDFCQELEACCLIVESIWSLSELMRGQREMSWIVCHLVHNLFLF